MLKETLNHIDLTSLTVAGLVLFFIVFVAVTLFAITRPQKHAEQWSRIPLNSETDDLHSRFE